jgi:hypothetical protein
VAGHARQDRVDAGAGQAEWPQIGQFVEDVAQEGGAVDRAKDRRGFA